jgi:hypothetical protein
LRWVLEDQSSFSGSVYAEAYHRAAKTLTRSLLRTMWPSLERDGGVIPLLFLWRHHLEISLKVIIAELAAYTDKTAPAAVESTHDLTFLWRQAEKGLRQFVLDDVEVRSIAVAVKSFSGFDPDSQAFRYPRLKGGRRAAPGLDQVDARRLDRAMTNVAKALRMARDGLDGLLYEKEQAEQSRDWY